MKNFLSILFLVCVYNVHAQYGGQDSIRISVGTATITALVHKPDDYLTDTITKHPLIIFQPGAGQYGINASELVIWGPPHFIKTGEWTGNEVNPKTGLLEKFISVGLLSPRSSGPIGQIELDSAITYIYSNYRVDTNKLYLTGLSRGGSPTIDYPSHILSTNCCPFVWTFFAPSHKVAAIVPMSAENNSSDPVNYFVADRVHAWGFGSDTTKGQSDIHGATTHDFIKHVNAAKAGFGRFTNYVGGHCCWNNFYTPKYTEIINGISMNIYQWMLMYSQPSNQIITTGTINGSPFCVTHSSGASISVPFTSTGTFNSGNIYTAQLSTNTGSFSSPTTIGTLASTANSGTISSIIPVETITGNNYLMRVISSNPDIIGTESTTTVAINLADNSIAPTADQNTTVGTNGTTLTVTEQSTPISRTWYYGTTLGTYNTSTEVTTTTYTPNFASAGVYYVVCKSVYSCKTAKSNPVTINVSAGLLSKVYVQQKSKQQATLLVQANSDNIICNYSLNKGATVVITVYDEYGRAHAKFNENRTAAGSYSHTFNQRLTSGMYIVTLGLNGQPAANQRILIGQ